MFLFWIIVWVWNRMNCCTRLTVMAGDLVLKVSRTKTTTATASWRRELKWHPPPPRLELQSLMEAIPLLAKRFSPILWIALIPFIWDLDDPTPPWSFNVALISNGFPQHLWFFPFTLCNSSVFTFTYVIAFSVHHLHTFTFNFYCFRLWFLYTC